MTASLGIWARAARVPFLTASLVPVLLGSSMAWHETGRLSWWRLLLTALGAALIHLGANLANEHGDHVTGADDANPLHTRYSGGSGVIQDGLLSPRSVLLASVFSFCGGAATGLYLNLVSGGNAVLALGAVGVFLAYSYSARPLTLGYRGYGLGEMTVAVCFGPLLLLGAYYVQTGTLSWRVLLLSIPLAILITLVLVMNGLPDCEADRASGKRTLVVTVGKRHAVLIYHALLWVTFVVMVLFAATRVMPPACLVALLAAPLAWRAVSVSSRHYEDAELLRPANAATIALHSAVGLLLAAGFIIDRIV